MGTWRCLHWGGGLYSLNLVSAIKAVRASTAYTAMLIILCCVTEATGTYGHGDIRLLCSVKILSHFLLLCFHPILTKKT
jgi:hypothetical protein